MAKVTVPGLSKASGETGFEPWKPGLYRLECTEFKDMVASTGSKGNQVRFSILGVEDEDLEVQNEREVYGKPIFDFIYFQKADDSVIEMGMNQLKNLLNAAGVKVTGDGFNPEAMIGKIVWAQVKVEKNKQSGDMVNRITSYVKDDDE